MKKQYREIVLMVNKNGELSLCTPNGGCYHPVAGHYFVSGVYESIDSWKELIPQVQYNTGFDDGYLDGYSDAKAGFDNLILGQ